MANEADVEATQQANVNSDSMDNAGTPKNKGEGKVLRRKSSSEIAEQKSTARFAPPSFINWFEIPFRITDPTTGAKLREATGWGMDACARGPLNSAGSFVGSALLRLATIDAGGRGNKIYGLKPSSLLTAASASTGIAAAIIMPFVGAIVDHTSLRKTIGIVTAVILCALTLAQFWLSIDNWFDILILESVNGFMLLIHFATVLAYLPDLTRNQDDLPHYTSQFAIRQFAIQSLYTAIIIVMSEIRDIPNPLLGTVQTAKDAVAVAFGFAAVFMTYAWLFCFRKRDALRPIPKGRSLITTGFIQVAVTSKKIIKEYHSLKWFMISLLWSPENGAGVVLTIAVTFLTAFIRMNGKEIGFVNLIMLVSNIPGNLFAKWCCNKFNPLNSYRAALIFFATVSTLTFITLDSPEKKNYIYPWAILWGIAYGWLYPTQRVLFCTLIPKNQEAEMMGLFTFSGQILGWLLPLIFTVMNEKGVEIRWSSSMIACFIALAFVCTLPMGKYEDALQQVAETDEERTKMEKATEKDEDWDKASEEFP